LTVTGRTLGENLDDIRRGPFFAETRGYLHNFHIEQAEVLRPRDDP